MRSVEALVGEAVAQLTVRLEKWGVDDSTARAHEFIQDMLRAGWRPAAPALPDFKRVPVEQIVTREQAHAYAEMVRREMAAKEPQQAKAELMKQPEETP